jgi:hypothetical protein
LGIGEIERIEIELKKHFIERTIGYLEIFEIEDDEVDSSCHWEQKLVGEWMISEFYRFRMTI